MPWYPVAQTIRPNESCFWVELKHTLNQLHLVPHIYASVNRVSIVSDNVSHSTWSEGIELLKMLVKYILSSVCLRLSQFSQLSFIQYMGLCVFSLPIYLMMIVRIRVLYFIIIIIKSEVWSIFHCLWWGHETVVCAVCLFIFLCTIFYLSRMIFAVCALLCVFVIEYIWISQYASALFH